MSEKIHILFRIIQYLLFFLPGDTGAGVIILSGGTPAPTSEIGRHWQWSLASVSDRRDAPPTNDRLIGITVASDGYARCYTSCGL
ncbi:hypothetical protein Y032_0100g3257 [Ancylostoma ceylanicum]|uniref:Uncharacterized protein n=1 Tax=Ancylostoma ceylanicum TaxID=53326 RepID=A0A016TI62_9BILA|nr:hypothetical protein Y032_0100g3257 [Ancylostoma ceylanicum]